MENSNIIKQAKSDIFKVLHPIIVFYINKGAKPNALKKYYKNNKKLNDILDDIKNKGNHLVKDESEYKKLVRDTLNDILDDFIAKNKDEEYKNKQKDMKHIKEFYNFEMNEGFLTIFIGGYLFFKFIQAILRSYVNRLANDQNTDDRKMAITFLTALKKIEKIPVSNLSDRFFMRVIMENEEYDIRLMKNEKLLVVDSSKLQGQLKLKLSDEEYNNFISLIQKK